MSRDTTASADGANTTASAVDAAPVLLLTQAITWARSLTASINPKTDNSNYGSYSLAIGFFFIILSDIAHSCSEEYVRNRRGES